MKRTSIEDWKIAHKIEMDAKNEAYLFIIKNGQMDNFLEFCKRNRKEESFLKCKSILKSAH